MTRRILWGTGIAATDTDRLQKLHDASNPGDCLEVRGVCAIDKPFIFTKPLHAEFDRGAYFSLEKKAAVILRDTGPLASITDPLWGGADEGDSIIKVPTASVRGLRTGEYLFLWSQDALAVTPHGAGGIQSPGECHAVDEFREVSSGVTRIVLRSALRDSMTVAPRISLRNTLGWRNITWNNAAFVEGPGRTETRCFSAIDCPGLTLNNLYTYRAGEVAINCPDFRASILVDGQRDRYVHYGIVLGAPCSGFHVTASGHGCRHLTDTAGGYPVTIGERTHWIGTPWGHFQVNVKGRYNAPVSTHSAGKGITISGFAECVAGTNTAATDNDENAMRGGAVLKIRSRNTVVQGMTIRGSEHTKYGVFGVDCWAPGTIIDGGTIEECYAAHVASPGGSYSARGVTYRNITLPIAASA